ncbi:membrane-targeted effector domain-containing toxin [Pseudomonas sp. PB106]|uniref:membrane-targeted effector domain-containing toxin n=1 Tax=Pseudomonas sp. PB106 TaxID=2494699 RepID=UPI00131D878C|nr:membrane-targeted effector domain-containing toxin [Pseudomonas sp. PB106]KAE9646057.1 hypothetical protein EJA71_10815 [Pseudomonas sp. PB106]
MPSPSVPVPSTDARQSLYLQQLLYHQLALKHMLDQQPEAGKVLTETLSAALQRAFPGLPLPIALEAVSYREDIWLSAESGALTLLSTDQPLKPFSALFTEKPWGGEHLDAPNRLYRFYAKAVYTGANRPAFDKAHTVSGSTSSTPAFETFIDGLIRRPDRHFQQQLDNFWQAPVSQGETPNRRQWLADRLASALLAEAALRSEDGTLEATGKTLIEQIVSHPSSRARAHLPGHQRPAVFSLSLKGHNSKPDIPLIGIYILANKTPVADIQSGTDIGAVVLLTPDRGIDTFASLQAMEQSLQSSLHGEDKTTRLASYATWQNQGRARRYLNASPDFAYVPVEQGLFEHRVDTLLTLQKQDVEHGWRQVSLHEANGEYVHQRLNRLGDIGAFLDIRDLLIARSQRCIEANLPPWYPAASAQDQQALKQLALAEMSANQTLASLMRKTAIPSLKAFARAELIRQLALDYPGSDLDPDKVQVNVITRLNPASLAGGIGPDQVPDSSGQSIPPERSVSLSLTELALRNSNPWDFSFYKLFTGEHTSMSASALSSAGKPLQFDDPYLNSLIRALDVGKGYDRLLHTRLIDNGGALRTAWIAAHRATLATETLAARMDPSCLLKDRQHRGHQWMTAIAESDLPGGRRKVGGHPIVVSSLMISSSPGTRNGYVLNDVLVIHAENLRAVPNVILYTPSAPTGQSFKEFADSASLQQFLRQQWLTSAEWRRYVMQRLSTPGQTLLSESKAARTLLLSERVLSSKSRVSNPFETLHTFPINTSLPQALYEQQVMTLRRNADHASTTNAEVDAQSLWNQFNFALDLAFDLIGFLPITSSFNAVRSVTRTFALLHQAGRSKVAARALWSITGARARPLTLRKIGTVPAFNPQPDLARVDVPVDPSSLERLKGNLYQSKTSPQQYALLDGKYYLTDIAQGQRYIYPPGTASKTLRYPLVLDKSLKHWQAEPLPRLRGGMDPIEKGPLQTSFRDYELPASDVVALTVLDRLPAGALNLGYLNPAFTMSPGSIAALHIFGIQARLRRHARQFFKSFPPPPRTIVLPRRGISLEQLFQHLFQQREGLILGEKHVYSITRQFLIKNMPELKKAGVKTFYLELFNTDLHQTHLDMFNTSPSHPLPDVLKDRLQVIDQMALQNDSFSYTRLIEEAHAQGINIMALDTTASSLYTSGDLSLPRPVATLADQLDRVTMFNFFAYKRITEHQLITGRQRWIALTGQGHCNTLQGIPGLAEITNATGVRLERRIGNQMVARVSADPGVVIYSPSGTHQFIHKCDLLVRLSSAENKHELVMRVHSPQLFTTTSNQARHSGIHYMNAQHQHVDVTVFADGTQAYVNHPPFGAVSNRRFHDLDALTEALTDELGMIEV